MGLGDGRIATAGLGLNQRPKKSAQQALPRALLAVRRDKFEQEGGQCPVEVVGLLEPGTEGLDGEVERLVAQKRS